METIVGELVVSPLKDYRYPTNLPDAVLRACQQTAHTV